MEIVSKRTSGELRPGPAVMPSPSEPVVVRLTAELAGGERKSAVVAQDVPKGSEWVMLSDEGAGIGGEDTAPEPLSYFGAAVAF